MVQGLLRDRAHVLPVDADAAGRHVIKAWDQAAQRAFAAAGRADDRNGLAGPDMQGDVLEHLLIFLIGERDVLNVDRAADMPERFRIRRVAQLRLRAHQLDEAAKARKAVGEHLGKIHELAHGARERGDIQGEREQVDQIHPALHDERAAHGDNGHAQDREEKLQRAGENAHLAVEFPL